MLHNKLTVINNKISLNDLNDSLSIFKVEYKIEVATPLEKTKIKMTLRVSVVEQSSTLINSVALTGKTVFRIQVPEEKFINFNFNIGIVLTRSE